MWTLQNERNRNVQIKIYEREYGFPKNGFRFLKSFGNDMCTINSNITTRGGFKARPPIIISTYSRLLSKISKTVSGLVSKITVVEIVWRILQSFSSVPA